MQLRCNSNNAVHASHLLLMARKQTVHAPAMTTPTRTPLVVAQAITVASNWTLSPAAGAVGEAMGDAVLSAVEEGAIMAVGERGKMAMVDTGRWWQREREQ